MQQYPAAPRARPLQQPPQVVEAEMRAEVNRRPLEFAQAFNPAQEHLWAQQRAQEEQQQAILRHRSAQAARAEAEERQRIHHMKQAQEQLEARQRAQGRADAERDRQFLARQKKETAARNLEANREAHRQQEQRVRLQHSHDLERDRVKAIERDRARGNLQNLQELEWILGAREPNCSCSRP